MSLSKATPRSVTPIVPTAGFSAPMVTGVIPIRGTTPPSPAQAVTAPDALTRRPRVRSVPVEQRPWRVLLVPPTPGARTRAFDLARWQARLILSAVVVLLLIAAGAVTTVIVALDSPDLLATSVTDALPLFGREPRERKVVQVDESAEQLARRIQLHREARLGEIDLLKEGLPRLQWWVLDWNAPSIEFYKSLGAVPQDEWTVFRVSGEALDKLAAQ